MSNCSHSPSNLAVFRPRFACPSITTVTAVTAQVGQTLSLKQVAIESVRGMTFVITSPEHDVFFRGTVVHGEDKVGSVTKKFSGNMVVPLDDTTLKHG